jgi:hypothetical protein
LAGGFADDFQKYGAALLELRQWATSTMIEFYTGMNVSNASFKQRPFGKKCEVTAPSEKVLHLSCS